MSGTLNADQLGLKLTAISLLSSDCWDYRCVPLINLFSVGVSLLRLCITVTEHIYSSRSFRVRKDGGSQRAGPQ